MKGAFVTVLAVAALTLSDAFQSPLAASFSVARTMPVQQQKKQPLAFTNSNKVAFSLYALNMNQHDGNGDGDDSSSSSKRNVFLRAVASLRNLATTTTNNNKGRKSILATTAATVLAAAAAAPLAGVILVTVVAPKPALASAPVMALPKAEDRDPLTQALQEASRRQTAELQKELQNQAKEARKIEATEGEGARIKYEKDLKVKQQTEAVAKQEGLVTLKRNLLNEGTCPFTDMEAKRQIVLYEDGVDLGEVQGTPFALEAEWIKSSPKKSQLYKKAPNRRMVACMVQDMVNRGLDPLEYFEKHQDQTMSIMDMDAAKAVGFVQKYEANLEEYGQITVPAEGELSAKEKLKSVKPDKAVAAAAKAAAKRIKAEEKAVLKEQAAVLKAEKKAAKQAAKQEASAAKQAAKAAAVAAAAGMAVATESLQGTVGSVQAVTDQAAQAVEQQMGAPDMSETTESAVEDSSSAAASTESLSSQISKSAPVAAAVLVAAGGGGYAFKLYKDKAADQEEERQRQFRLLMGEDDDSDSGPSIAPGSAPALEEIETDLTDLAAPPKKAAAPAPAPEEAVPVAPKKRKLGLGRVFNKKNKDGRETDIAVLVGPDSDSAEFSQTLAKILTFGAPGRFPTLVNMPGGMPMDEFDLDAAKDVLVDAQSDAGLSVEDSAEIFANVVNCMLIDIVDLAATSLKEKDEKVTVAGIKIVVDYMNHAASLYASIAEGVKIIPVTYGGDLSKSKLEQMYSAYAVSGMMNMGSNDDDFDNQVELLKDVFQISEKKAEGLMMKAMQSNMMEMLKTGEGAEGMEEMLKGMGGMEGLGDMAGGGMPGMDGEPDPEQLKEMLEAIKVMKDSGTLPPAELEEVKAQFRDSFGSSIDQVIQDADSAEGDMADSEKELLGLIKSILDD